MSCGPSSSEQIQAGNNASLAQSLQSNYQNRFAKQSDILDRINQSIAPIIAAGVNQEGFSPEELANLNTQAINTTGAAARNATQSAQTSLAGRGGGGDSGLTSGINKQIAGSIASSEGGNLADTQNKITAADYAQGRQNYQNAVNETLMPNGLAEQEAPDKWALLAGNTGATAFGEQDKLSQENNAKSAAIAGTITSLAKPLLAGVTGGLGNLDTTGSSTTGEQIGSFFSGGFNALAGL